MRKADIQKMLNQSSSLSYNKGILESLFARLTNYPKYESTVPLDREFKITVEEQKALARAVGASLDMIEEGLKHIGEQLNGTSKARDTNRTKRRAPISKSKRNRGSSR